MLEGSTQISDGVHIPPQAQCSTIPAYYQYHQLNLSSGITENVFGFFAVDVIS